MAFARFLVSWKAAAELPEDTFTNTLYFNISGSVGQDPDYQALCNDVATLYRQQAFTQGRVIQVRAYDMADPKPRPQKAITTNNSVGSVPNAAPQVALAVSYFADRNLPRQRGRIFTGPWSQGTQRPSAADRTNLITFAQALGAIGGINVDWSLYSPTTDTHTRISNVWVDDSYDIIRARKLKATTRSTATING